MLRVAEHFARTDTGRERRANEDACFARAPLFVVADGMGGAQAGEVASGLAIDLFKGGLPDQASSGEERLATRAREANAQIHELSRSDPSRAGMGTTLTAVYVDDGEVSIAHVGDSRAYCLRDGKLMRLTDDHSLVAELLRRGQLTAEQAVDHPQRSIITRALGPEPDVQVDTRTHQARGGDVYLLCSDGLTSMIAEEQAAEIVRSASSLSEAGRRLIAAANEAGGRDNITVVLFRVEELSDPAEPGTEASVEATMAGATAPRASEVRDALARAAHGAAPPATAPPGMAPPGTAASPRRVLRPRLPPTTPATEGPRARRRLPLGVLAAIAVAALLGTGAWVASQTVYFIGTNQNGFITMFRGVPYELPGGLHLYSPNFISGVSAASIPPSRRAPLLDHTLRSHDDAADLIRRLERGQLTAAG